MKKILWISGAAISLALMAWFAFATSKIADISNALSCSGNLCCIGTYLHNYHEKYGHFPPAYQVDASGAPAHSWRVLLMLWDEPKLFADYRLDEPWNSPNNRKLESLMPSFFRCPSEKISEDSPNRWHTNYFVVVGNDTLFPGPKPISFKDLGRPAASTVMLVEATGQGIHWMEPRDLNYDTMSFEINDSIRPSLSAKHRFPNLAMADVTRIYSGNLSPDQFRKMALVKANVKSE